MAWKLVWQLAGIVGVAPGPLTLRELVWMADAKQTDDWNHTAAVLALLANVHRDPKKGRAFKPADFHPALKKAPAANAALPKVDVSILKTVFVRDGRETRDESPEKTSAP